LSRFKQSPFFILFSVAIIFLSSCSTAPSEEAVSAVIRDHFEGRGYKVAELRIGGISSVPLSGKTYMGTKGHVVEIRKIDLEVLRDIGDHKKGERLVFADASIRIREKADKKGGWIVAQLSGIPVP
jgi:hypothetical protein